MDKDVKLLLGRILGETLRVQKKLGMPCAARDGQIYGLIAGVEPAVDEFIGADEAITQEHIDKVQDVLDFFFNNPDELDNFKGYYTLETELRKRGWENVRRDRGKVAKVLNWIAADGGYQALIDKMNSQDSPAECKTFGPNEFER